MQKQPDSGQVAPYEVQRVLQSRAETRTYYDRMSHVYDLLSERSEEPARRTGVEMLAPRPGDRVLEIGFGTGHSLVHLAAAMQTGHVWGVELSRGMIEVARQCLATAGIADRVTLVQGDATALPLAGGTMDAALMSFMLELLDTDDIPRALMECRRVLRPGGRLAVVALSREGEGGMALAVYEWVHRRFPHLLDCRPIYARHSLEAAGFQRVEQRTLRIWLPVDIVLGVNPGPPADGLAGE